MMSKRRADLFALNSNDSTDSNLELKDNRHESVAKIGTRYYLRERIGIQTLTDLLIYTIGEFWRGTDSVIAALFKGK